MNASDIIEGARTHLQVLRDRVEQAAGEDWQHTCLMKLQEVTGLKLDGLAGCEIAFLSVIYGPAFSFPTREISQRASGMAENELGESILGLVDYFYKNLPKEPGEDEKGIFDVLGTYFRERRVIGARVELYWAKIAACSRCEHFEIEQLAKVVMLHELAHFVTHQGCNPEGFYWRNLPSGEEVIEVVTQMATEDVILALGDKTLEKAFDDLLRTQSRSYTGHREIRERFSKITAPKYDPYSPKDFWDYFPSCIRKRSDIKTVDGIIDKIEATEMLLKGSVETSFNLGW